MLYNNMFQNRQMYGNHLKYFENFKKELESRASQVGNLNYRKKKSNNKIERII